MTQLVKKYLLIYLTLIITFLIVNILGTSFSRDIFIDGDGSGHYAYLPSVLIYHSVDFNDVFEFEKQHRPPDYMGHNYHKHGDVLINKFTAGTSLLQLPFFLIGLLLSIIFGFAPDGYNIIFQYSIAIGTLFWVGIGISYFIKLLVTYGVDKRFAGIMAFVVVIGTNLFLYTFVQPSFSHAYSFSLISMFLYFARKVFLEYNRKHVIAASFLLGLIILVRPVNVIIVASLPFIAGTPQNFINAIKSKLVRHDYLPALLAFIVALSPQLIINYLQTGSLIIYSYQDEGFYFATPEFVNFLFSYRKGWFIYTPLFLLLFPAFVYLWKHRSAYSFFTLLLFFVGQVYLFSSWWNWYYGDSFGMRPMVDYYGLYFIVIALFIYHLKAKWVKIIIAVFVFMVVFLNLLQSYQYAVGIIHPDAMSKKSYWHIFLKIDEKCEKAISGGDESFYGHLSEKPFFTSSNLIETYNKGWSVSNHLNNSIACSDSLSVIQDSNNIYSPSFRFIIEDSLSGYGNLFVRFNASYYEMNINSALKAAFVVDIRDTADSSVFYKAFRLKHLPDNEVAKWKEGSIGFKLPEIKDNMEYIKLYIWNVDKQSYLLDDLNIALYTYSADK